MGSEDGSRSRATADRDPTPARRPAPNKKTPPLCLEGNGGEFPEEIIGTARHNSRIGVLAAAAQRLPVAILLRRGGGCQRLEEKPPPGWEAERRRVYTGNVSTARREAGKAQSTMARPRLGVMMQLHQRKSRRPPSGVRPWRRLSDRNDGRDSRPFRRLPLKATPRATALSRQPYASSTVV